MISFRRLISSFTCGTIAICGLTTSSSALRAQEKTSEKEWIKAPALKRGDTIALVAPAGPVETKTVKEFAEQLEIAGYKVIIPKGIERKSSYLAGTDDERASELNAAIRDPKVRAIFPVRGGYGLTRIVDRIDYATLRRDPKIVVGFSDLTALHLAIAREAHLITFHAPMSPRHFAAPENEASFAVLSFKRAILADQSKNRLGGYTIDTPTDRPKPVKLVGGKAQGRLMGGNLTMICATLGTPYAIQPKGAILFIEDLNEAPYRIIAIFPSYGWLVRSTP
jgi:muramoyltetrapeptide carboxypeptidase